MFLSREGHKSKVKEAVRTFAKSLLFFTVWALGISLVFSAYEKPSAIAHNEAMLRLYWEAAPLAMIIICTALAIPYMDKNRISVTITKNPLRDTILGSAFGLGWVSSVIFTLVLLGSLTFGASARIWALPLWSLALLMNAAMQELLVRGYLFSMIRHTYNSTTAVIATTALFLALHGGAIGVSIVAVLNVLTMSIFVSLLLLWSEGLWASILAHFIWNLVAGIAINGIVLAGDYPNIRQISLHGSPLLAGGAAKIEGSIVTLGVNLMLTGVTVFMLRRKYQLRNGL
jgi:membrane protease YdiL (CAAX protease family)